MGYVTVDEVVNRCTICSVRNGPLKSADGMYSVGGEGAMYVTVYEM